jgi:hypothetical protein
MRRKPGMAFFFTTIASKEKGAYISTADPGCQRERAEAFSSLAEAAGGLKQRVVGDNFYHHSRKCVAFPVPTTTIYYYFISQGKLRVLRQSLSLSCFPSLRPVLASSSSSRE